MDICINTALKVTFSDTALAHSSSNPDVFQISSRSKASANRRDANKYSCVTKMVCCSTRLVHYPQPFIHLCKQINSDI